MEERSAPRFPTIMLDYLHTCIPSRTPAKHQKSNANQSPRAMHHAMHPDEISLPLPICTPITRHDLKITEVILERRWVVVLKRSTIPLCSSHSHSPTIFSGEFYLHINEGEICLYSEARRGCYCLYPMKVKSFTFTPLTLSSPSRLSPSSLSPHF